MSEEYRIAYERSGEAIRKFRVAQQAYRAREIGDREFLAARRAYDAAMAGFDAAYAREQETAGDPH